MIAALRDDGYTVVGPTRRDGAITLGEIGSTADLPAGQRTEQRAGRYRVVQHDDGALFASAVGPGSVKGYLHPAEALLVRSIRNGVGFRFASAPRAPRYAFFGIRPCDAAAIAIQDRVFIGGRYRDATYGSRRDGAVLIVANCVEPGGTCFCASMGTGPRVQTGFDLAMTEVVDGDDCWYLAEAGSTIGSALLERSGSRPAMDEEVRTVSDLLDRAAASMGRSVATEGLAATLAASLDSPRWEQIAQRCLTCANCMLVCPTCFCATVDDETSLSGDEALRVRRWDSCFNEEFSYIHGGALRPSPSARYRQWLTHKLSTWVDQFGTAGCVGCGRCITWCPAGIDLTVEAAALVEEAASRG